MSVRTKPAQVMGLVAALLAVTTPAFAQEEGAVPAAPSITVELNNTAQQGDACQLTFVLGHTLDDTIDALVLEAVLLTTDGAVDRLTLFDMRDLPAARPRVRQFNVPDLSCADLGQVLINGVATCQGAGLSPAICADALSLSTRTEIEVLG